jgi:hypothetical protein
MSETPDFEGSTDEVRAASVAADQTAESESQSSEKSKTAQSDPSDAGSTAELSDAPSIAKPSKRARRPLKKRHHVHRFGLWFCSMILFLALLAGLAILALTGQDITLPATLTKHIERQINSDLGDTKVSVGEITVTVDKNFVPRAHALNVGIIDPSGSEIARLNELQAQFSLGQIRSGQLTPQKLYLSGAQIVVRRRTDGSFVLDFGGAAGAVGSSVDVLKAIDSAFSTQPLSDVQVVEARGLTISLEDARSNRVWLATNASITLANSPQNIDISMDFDVFNGTEDLARLQLGFATQKGSLATTVALNIQNAPALDVAQQSPALSFLSVLDAPISAAMRAQVDTNGLLSSYSGKLEIGSGQLVAGAGAKPLSFDGAKGYFDYDPSTERLSFPELSLHSDTFEVAGRGHLLLRDFEGNFPKNFIGQFDIERLAADPKDIFTQPVEFHEGAVDLQLTLAPFSVRLGQVALRHGDLWVRGRGAAEATPEGWSMSLDANIDALQAADLMSFWPESMIPKTRVWMDTNITEAQYNDVAVSVRLAPGAQVPQTHLGWNFEDAQVRFMKTLPPVTSGAGYGTISGNALTVVVQDGVISAPTGGDIDVTGTVLRIPQLNVKPATLAVQLQTASNVEATLSLMAQKPFDVLKDAAFGPDVAQGQAQLGGRLSVPLIPKIQLTDVDFDITGDITNASSKQLLEGKDVQAQSMILALDPTGISLSGSVDVSGARAAAVWRKTFGPEHRGASDISGSVTINQAFLNAFDIELPAKMVSGAAQGDLNVALRKGKDPAFTVSSQMEGLGLSIPAIGFSKSKQRSGQFTISGTAGPVPTVTSLSVEAPGLSAQQGSVSLNAGGGLDRLSFEKLKVGTWLDSSVTLIGRGAGAPVAVRLGGGTLNLAKSPLGGSGGNSGASGPVDLVLDRLIITDEIALHGVSAKLTQNGGLSGQFSGRLNGSAPITGSVRPGQFGPVISAQAKDAGKAIMASGLLEKAAGGTLALTLTSRREDKSYDGVARIEKMKVLSAPKLAELLSLVSVVGLLDQLSGPGISFSEIVSSFTIQPSRITIASASAEGPSLGITANGIYDTASRQIDLQGVISPIYFLNGIGQIVSRKGEGLFGFNFTLGGTISNPVIGVNPLSILTPGALRSIFRKKPRTVTPE